MKATRTQHTLLSNKAKIQQNMYRSILFTYLFWSTYHKNSHPNYTCNIREKPNENIVKIKFVLFIICFSLYDVYIIYSRITVFSPFFCSFQVLFHHDQFTADLMQLKKQNNNKLISCKTKNNKKYLFTDE